MNNRLIVLLAVLVVPLLTRGEEPNPPRSEALEEARQHLKKWRAQFSSVRFTCEERNPNQVAAYQPELKNSPLLDGYFMRTTWAWAHPGAVWHDHYFYRAGKLLYRHVGAADGVSGKGFEAVYKDTATTPQFLESLTVYQTPKSGLGPGKMVMPLHHLWNGPLGHWLDEMIERYPMSLEGHEEIRGVRCLKLQVGRDNVWLDPSHDYLPVKSSPMPAEKRSGWDFDVLEFRQVGPGIWFPWRGTFWIVDGPPDEVTHWHVTELTVNQQLEESLFRMPVPLPATKVANTITRHSYQPADRAAKRPQLADADVLARRIRSVETSSFHWGWSVVFGGALAFLFALAARSGGRKVIAGVGVCVVYGLVVLLTFYWSTVWFPAIAFLALEALVAVLLIRAGWGALRQNEPSSPPAMRPGLRFSMQTLLLGMTAIAGGLGLAVHFQPLIAWRYGPNWELFDQVHKTSVVSMPETAVPADWQQGSLGSLHFALPPQFGKAVAAEDGSCVALFNEGSATGQSIYISFPATVDPAVESQISNDVPSFRRDWSVIRREVACYQTGRDDFRWTMTPQEFRWHLWCLTTRRKLWGSPADGRVETHYGEDLEGILLVAGDGTAFFEWRARDKSVEGGITFYGIDGEADAEWLRIVCQSVRLSNHSGWKPTNATEALRALEILGGDKASSSAERGRIADW